MTNEERNTALYKKMYAEQEQYRDWLLGQPPETILHHAYEYAAREDLLLSFEYNDLTDARAESLLSSEKPLEEAFHAYECRETGYMDEVFSCLESAAESLIREKQLADKASLYRESAAYAREHSELDAYRASHKANVACREAIENAIRDNYNNNRLDTSCVKPIMDRFGVDRVEYVLANTVQHKDWDERFSSSNRAWAKTIPVVTDGNDFVGDRRTDFVVDRSHSGLTDLFVTAFRKEARQLEQAKEAPKRESVLAMLKQPLPVHGEHTPHKSEAMDRG